MPSIHALRQRKVEIRRRTQAILDAAQAAGRNLTAEESTAYERDISSLQKLEVEIVAAEAELESERRMPCAVDENSAFAARANPGVAIPSIPVHGQPGRASGKRTWASVFGESHDTAGFSSIQEFFKSVRQSDRLYDPRLAPLAAGSPQTEGVPSDGGFMVPTEFASRLLDNAIENAIVFPRAQVWPMKSDALKVPGIDDTDHSGNVLFGSVAPFWANELQSIDLQNLKTWQLQLSAAKFALLAQSSNELADDSVPDFEGLLVSKLQAAAQWHLDVAFLFGDGSQGKPTGALSAVNPALITVAKETVNPQPAGSFVYRNAVNMYSALHPNCRPNAVWLVSSDLLPQLLTMYFPISQPDGSDLVGGIPPQVVTTAADGTYRLLGLPVITSEKLSPAGTVGDVALVDLSQYAVGLRKWMSVERSREAGFTNDSSYWRLIIRVAGQSSWKAGIKGKNGKTQSPFVVLAARN
jgi:HK97 family phage major capsid protein